MSHLFSRTFTLTLLTLTFLLSLYFIIILQITNNLIPTLDALALKNPHYLPHSKAVFRTTYTHFWPLDALMSRMAPFFWPLVTAQAPELTLFGVYMAGQVVACEVAVVVEGLRAGNRERVVSYSTLWGLLWQNLPWGCIAPLYALIHVLTSKLKSDPAVRPAVVSITARNHALRSLPLAIIIGFVLPSIAMCLPSPKTVSYDTQQLLLFIWQLFPLWIGISHWLLQRLPVFKDRNNTPRDLESSRRASLAALRSVYTFGIGVAALSHIAIITVCLFPAQAAVYLPASFVPSKKDAWAALRPFPPFSGRQIKNIPEGVLSLLQYDTIFAGLGMTLLAAYLYTHSLPRRGIKAELWLLVKIVLYTLLTGPCGVALCLIKERDEMVFGPGQVSRKIKVRGLGKQIPAGPSGENGVVVTRGRPVVRRTNQTGRRAA